VTAPARRTPDVAAADAVAVLMAEVTSGDLTAATMADRAVQRCREVCGQCDGPTDPLWSVHVDLCRAVLGHAGLPASELAQWLAVARNGENPGGAVDGPPGSVSSLSGPYSLDSGGADADVVPMLKAVVAEVDTVDAIDDDDEFSDVPDDVLDRAEAASMAVIEDYRRQREESR